MAKILISWVAFQTDFTEGKMPVNNNGPNSIVHKQFWNYDYHLLLSNTKDNQEDVKLLQLASYLGKTYGHKIEQRSLVIHDVIDVSEISGKINSLLYSLREHEIDIFISPGTPAMQVAWYFAHVTLALNTKLFQVRKTEHTKGKNKSEQVWVTVEQSKIPTALMISEELKDKPKDIKFLITKSAKPVYVMAKKVASANDTTVLILGETGTGKEGLAKYIHDHSPRAKGPFIAVNCAGMGESLLESRLFGYTKGSHSTASKETPGLFEDANNGTIFLDEIGDISPYMQQSLLRVLQEKEISLIGESKIKKLNIRIIAATNQDLPKQCSEGKFRWDLYYRLSVVDLTLPSLKERGVKETEELFNFILEKKAVDYRQPLLKISIPIRKKIFSYPFPGNIRELENFVERLYVIAEENVTENELPRNFTAAPKEHSLKLDDVINEHVRRVYEMCDKNITKTAKILGKSSNTVKAKLDNTT